MNYWSAVMCASAGCIDHLLYSNISRKGREVSILDRNFRDENAQSPMNSIRFQDIPPATPISACEAKPLFWRHAILMLSAW